MLRGLAGTAPGSPHDLIDEFTDSGGQAAVSILVTTPRNSVIFLSIAIVIFV